MRLGEFSGRAQMLFASAVRSYIQAHIKINRKRKTEGEKNRATLPHSEARIPPGTDG